VANVAGGVIRLERDGGHYEVRLDGRVLARERGRAAAMNAAEHLWQRMRMADGAIWKGMGI